MIRRATIAAVLSLLTAGSACADDASDAVRAEFKRAYAIAIADGDTGHVPAPVTDSKTLRDYILYPYLQQARLHRAMSDTQSDTAALDGEVANFLHAHENETVSVELRRAWYTHLSRRMAWEKLLEEYRDVNDPSLYCQTLTARLALQRFDNLQVAAVSTWSTSPDSLIACDPVFSWLQSQGVLTDALVEKRARVALAAGKADFARQMVALLPEDKAEPLRSWVSLIKSPKTGIDAAIASPTKPIETAALFDGWTRLVRRDLGAGLERYQPLIKARGLSAETASRMALELAQVLAWNRRGEALEYFSRVRAGELDDRGAEWSARAALWAGNWKRAATIIAAMPASVRQQTKWRYWAARVAELRGNRPAARTQYAGLLNDDNYYAALAAARLKKPYTPKPQPLNINEELVRNVAAQAPFARAHELLSVDVPGMRAFAYDEWRKGYLSLDSAGRKQSIALAARWGWFDQAILTAAQQNFFDDYELLYPHPFDADVHGASALVNVPEVLIYATLRQESLYRIDAQSNAGAKGLMQLIGDTARRTERRWPEMAKAIRDPKDLLNPTTNIYMGSAKLRELIDRFGGNTAPALAAYNAGPLAVDRWLPSKPMDIDIWIENIPYNETRIYVQRILWHSVVFGWIANHGEQSTEQWLTQIGPRPINSEKEAPAKP